MTLRATLKQWFSRGKKPTAAQFSEWIDSFWHKSEDTIEISDIHALPQTLNEKSDVGHKHTLADITDYSDEKETVNCIAVDFIVDDIEDEVGSHIGIGKICAITGASKAILRYDGADWTKLLDLYDGIKVICIRENAFYEKYDGEFSSIFAAYDAANEEWVDASPDQDGIPSTAVIYMAEHYGSESDEADSRIYLFNDSTCAFQDVADPTGKYIQDGTIYVRNITTALEGYTEKGMYNLCYTRSGPNRIGRPAETKTIFFTFTVTTSGSTITQTLSNHDGYMTRSKVADGDWSNWDGSEYSFDGHGHDINDIHDLPETLNGKSDVGHTHNPEDITGLNGLLNGKADLVENATEGNFAALDANGNPTDSGKKAADFATAAQGAKADTALQSHQDISGKQDKTDNTLLTTVKTIVGAINELWNKFTDYLKGIQQITYAQLVTLRNNGELVPGQRYRITDYTCTTTQPETRSAGHVFDIIVTADDATTLNENARAVKHVGDTYFNGSKLSAWKLKYCLDNDITRFAWADTESGKGVIYYLEDEFGNLAEYDFKNIQFKRYRATIKEEYEGILGDSKFMLLQDNDEGWYDINDSMFELDTDDYIWCYTFHDIVNGNKDGSLNHFDGEAYNPRGVFKNSIPCNRISVSYDEVLYTSLYLSNIVHYVTLPTGDDYDTEGIWTCGNEFGIECQNLTFSKKCRNSKFIGSIRNTTFGGYIWNATFGGYIERTTFGGDIGNTTFGGYIGYTTFGGNLYNGHIHGRLYDVSIGSAGETWYNLVIDPGVEYMSVTCTEAGAGDVKNVHIFSGVCGTNSTPLTVSIPTRNNALLEIKPTTKTEILV